MPQNARSKLAAVMFTDIVGYSRFMSENEVEALRLLETHNTILLPVIENHDGKVVKTMGDGLLIDFQSARRACECAMAIQDAIDLHNKQDKHSFHLRIGIHIGDIFYTDNDIFGDDVNITSRLVPLANPGGIIISADVYTHVSTKINAEFIKKGKQVLKNISREIEIYELKTGHEQQQPRNHEENPFQKMKKDFMYSGSEEQKGEKRSFIDKDDDPAFQVKKKVFNVVNRFMDKAINEWNKQPVSKRKEITEKANRHMMRGGPMRRHWNRNREEEEPEDQKNEIPAGLIMTIGFGTVLIATQVWYFIFPLMFAGLIPLSVGLKRYFNRRKNKKELKEPKTISKTSMEKEILQLARSNNGRVTVLQAASDTSMSIDEAKDTLDNLVKHSHAQLQIEDSGLLVYEFYEFMKEE